MHGWQANKKGTCALPVKFRAMPENEKPPAMRVDIYCIIRLCYFVKVQLFIISPAIEISSSTEVVASICVSVYFIPSFSKYRF